MKQGTLNPAYMRALAEGRQVIDRHGDRSFSRIDEIVFDGGNLEFRWEGETLITYDLTEIIAESRHLPVSIDMEVRIE
jgi:hypothetical protein